MALERIIPDTVQLEVPTGEVDLTVGPVSYFLVLDFHIRFSREGSAGGRINSQAAVDWPAKPTLA